MGLAHFVRRACSGLPFGSSRDRGRQSDLRASSSGLRRSWHESPWAGGRCSVCCRCDKTCWRRHDIHDFCSVIGVILCRWASRAGGGAEGDRGRLRGRAGLPAGKRAVGSGPDHKPGVVFKEVAGPFKYRKLIEKRSGPVRTGMGSRSATVRKGRACRMDAPRHTAQGFHYSAF